MSKKITFINQKGGVGKTTVCVNVAADLAMRHYRTLLIDTDPQANASCVLADISSETPALCDVLTGEASLSEAIINVRENLFLLPSGQRMWNYSFQAVREDFEGLMGKFRAIISELEQEYDIIAFDTNPYPATVCVLALAFSDGCVTPIVPEPFAWDGYSIFMNLVREINEAFNPKLRNYGVVVNNFNASKNLHKEIISELFEQLPEEMFKAIIRTNSQLSRMGSEMKTIFEIEPPSGKGNKDFTSLTDELLVKLELGLRKGEPLHTEAVSEPTVEQSEKSTQESMISQGEGF